MFPGISFLVCERNSPRVHRSFTMLRLTPRSSPPIDDSASEEQIEVGHANPPLPLAVADVNHETERDEVDEESLDEVRASFH